MSSSSTTEASAAMKDYNDRSAQGTQFVMEAASAEQKAMIRDRANQLQRAISYYVQASNRLSEALAVLPLHHPDSEAIRQHKSEIDARANYLRDTLDSGVDTAGVPLEQQIHPVSLTMTSTEPVETGVHRGATKGAAMGGAAAIGGLGGLLLLGPIGLVAGAAGAAYVTTRSDKIGSAARTVGSATTNVTSDAVEKGAEIGEEYGVTQKVRGAADAVSSKAREFDQTYDVSGKVNSGVQAVGSKMSEINQQYQISEKVGSSLSRGMSAMNNWISGNHQDTNNRPLNH
ncbi:hypothetical protein FOZ61_004868 [Perkinsus olseni]|uniref:Uncharacterized protein n=1 Tax=Perkinsus olseni TaxID=32597 RepID=A0A7J6LJF0_PEROL|nr:hypothetical protein FOZ61_004868 [Perkinsus olseni]KAF4663908.1 hypothetical protein FOL46_004503 [Perkinsus olseni]